jgi:hypothetical protein
MWGSHSAMTLASDLEAQGIGRCVSIPFSHQSTKRVLPDERGLEKSLLCSVASQDAEQVPTVKQS